MIDTGWWNRSYNAKNQPVVSAFVYDKNGNKIGNDQLGAISYDWTDNATQFNNPSRFGVNQYGYSADGLPVWRQGTHVDLRYLIYDGKDPILEADNTGAVRAINTFGANGLISRAVITPGAGGAQANSGVAGDFSDSDSATASATPPALPYQGPGGTTSVGGDDSAGGRADRQDGRRFGGNASRYGRDGKIHLLSVR